MSESRHPGEEDLILRHYGEPSVAARVEDHLARCGECRSRAEEIAGTLALLDAAATVPERDEAYGRRVWQSLSPRLASPGVRRPLFAARPWILATGFAAVVVAAFLAGRLFPRTPAPPAPLSAAVRERILLVAVGDHLERSEMVLLEFVNTGAGEPGRETRTAEHLVQANRLYRQSAVHAGDRNVAAVLDELERVLLEVAHAPTPASREALRRRIESEGTVFKIRILSSQVREREKPVPSVGTRSL